MQLLQHCFREYWGRYCSQSKPQFLSFIFKSEEVTSEISYPIYINFQFFRYQNVGKIAVFFYSCASLKYNLSFLREKKSTLFRVEIETQKVLQ